ncbi:hypothetical protein [Psychromarinibacter sp. S121]|uniref:hypothetical protein n=1 Tax=Psychromarinibacter sp. S121 TaxID=3415127 RepID=UPI003C7ED60D
MKLSHLLLTTSLCAVAAVPAMAQSRTFSSVDANGDGQLSRAELEAAFGRQGAGNILRRSDRDRNGFVSASEIQMSHDDDSNDDESDDDRYDRNNDDDSSDDEGDDRNDDESNDDRNDDRSGDDDHEDDDSSDDDDDDDGDDDEGDDD